VFTEAFPIISTPDLQRALSFYQGLLDGRVEYRFPPDGDHEFVGLAIGDSELGLARDAGAASESSPQRFSLWVYAESCDDAIDRLRDGGVTVTEEPADQPWGERVGRVLDPDGNEVIIGERR
jgi:lactoylglutathione lyase